MVTKLGKVDFVKLICESKSSKTGNKSILLNVLIDY